MDNTNTAVNNGETKRNEVSYKNSLDISGNISQIGELKNKSNGKPFRYIHFAQNDRNGTPSYYQVFLDGEMLEKFNEKDFKVGDKIAIVGKVETFQKDSKTSYQIRPFDLDKNYIEKNNEKGKIAPKEQNSGIEI